MPSLINTLLAPALLALLASALTIALLVRSRVTRFALDQPNQRSLHTMPTPRLGGIGILAGVGASWLYVSPGFDMRLAAALLMLAAISLLDDVWRVSVALRFAVHLMAAGLATAALLLGKTELWIVVAAALALTWMINLYNFMDGSDGLAGGMAALGFGTYGVTALAGGDFLFASLNLSIAAAALGFLIFNFPPARVFMGDAGSIPLGYLAFVMGILGWQRGHWPWWLWAVVFSPFVVDATVTLIKRAARGERIWRAHREHYYQRLVQAGWGHRRTAYAEYGLMLVCGVAAFAIARFDALQLALAGALAAGYAILIATLERTLRGVHV